nr:Chain A, peptide PaAMP1R3 [synthetic construct]
PMARNKKLLKKLRLKIAFK